MRLIIAEFLFFFLILDDPVTPTLSFVFLLKKRGPCCYSDPKRAVIILSLLIPLWFQTTGKDRFEIH